MARNGCWKIKHKTKKYTIYVNEKMGETVPIWKGKTTKNKKAYSYIRKHGGKCRVR